MYKKWLKRRRLFYFCSAPLLITETLVAFVWTMENNFRIEIILTGIATLLLLIFLVIIPIDIMDFYGDKETYAKVYDLNTKERNWEWEYLSRWIYMGLLIIVGLTVITMRLIKSDNEIIRKINWTFLFLFFGSMIIGFYNWMKAGFDH
jgi:hypothetical protein